MLKNHTCLCKEIRGRICRKRYFSNVACQVFDEIPRGVYAREAAKQHMDSLGKKPTKYTFCSALNSCAKTSNWYLGLQIHAQVIQTGHEENLFISSALVDVYAKCGELADAWRVFDSMKMHDQVSWTSIIAGYSQNGDGRQAILLFKEMLRSQITPNAVTYVGVISACTGLELAFECGISLHAHVVKLGTDRNSFVVSSLIDCYSKCGRVEQAVLLLDARAEKDIVLLNSMISGYSQNLFGEEALKLFIQMQKYSITPTDHTLTSILNACGCLAVLQQGRQFHALVIKMGSTCNVFVACSLIDMYSKCGSINDARCVFDEAVKKNSVLWTSMISGYTQCGRGSCGLELFDYLVTKEGLMPDHVCLTAVLSACNHAGFLDRGIDYFNRMRRDYGLIPDLDQYACVIDLYARHGHLKKAKRLMEEMPFRPNSVIWSSFLHSCKVYGEIELGKQAALQLFKMEPQNAVPYITLASIYAGAGLWSEVAKTRKLLNLKELKKNTGWSWVEIGKEVHLFSVGDISHPQSPDIYVELEKLNSEMREVGCILESGENVDTECLLEEKRNLEQFYR